MLRIASDLGRAIGKGKINPVDLAEYFLDAIARHPLADRIDARTTQARARGEALAAASWAKSGMRKGLLDGVPLCETFDTVGRLAHCVEDCAQLLAALSGNKPADLTGCSLKGLRLMVLNTVTMDNLRDAPAKGFDDALVAPGRRSSRNPLPK